MHYRKIRRLITIYAIAGAITLGLFSVVCYSRLQDYRRQTGYDAARVFEETVGAIDHLSRSLEKGLYAGDGAMCAKICAEVYADARAAETALSALPFSTVENEQIQRFLGQVGDYAYTLCREAAEQGFSEEQREYLSELSEIASQMAERMTGMQGDVNNGLITMDSRERELVNIGLEDRRLLSAELGGYESEFTGPSSISYDGRYTAREEKAEQPTEEADTRRAAAEFLEVAPEELSLTAEYASGARRCYTLGSITVCAGAEGVESLSDSRLVSQSTIDEAQGEAFAEQLLEKLGYTDMTLSDSRRSGALLELSYACTEDSVTCLDRTLRLTIALDDGSLYALDARAMQTEGAQSEWPITEEEAQALVPDALELQGVRRVTLASPGGQSMACYELDCLDAQQGRVRLYINADSGKQQEIVIE